MSCYPIEQTKKLFDKVKSALSKARKDNSNLPIQFQGCKLLDGNQIATEQLPGTASEESEISQYKK